MIGWWLLYIAVGTVLIVAFGWKFAVALLFVSYLILTILTLIGDRRHGKR